MKTRKQFLGLIAIAIIAIIALPLAGCKSDEPTDTPKTITREFTITGFAKPITVKDMRTGADDVDLETLGVIERLTAGLTATKSAYDEYADDTNYFKIVISRELLIVIEDPAGAYQRMFAHSGNRMGINISYISTNPDDLASRLYTVFETMAEKKPDGAPEDTPRTLSFGTEENPCTVTITSDDQFTATEWKTLCDKVVAAIERGYGAAGAAGKEKVEEFFNENTLTVVLSKSATYALQVKGSEVGIIYMKANGSTIDGLIDNDLRAAVNAMTAKYGEDIIVNA
jgi:hypothetical protein